MSYNYALSPSDAQRHPLTAALLSVVPGLGQLYNGDKRKGILFLDVAIINFILLWFALSAQHLVEFLNGCADSFKIKPNDTLVQLLQHAQFGHPASLMLLAMMVAFAVYAARDAYDRAAYLKRKQIYPGFILELSEATSGSYIGHVVFILAFGLLALFFIIPKPDPRQIIDIEFAPPINETKIVPDAKKLAIKPSDGGKRDMTKPENREEAAPTQKAQTNPTTEEAQNSQQAPRVEPDLRPIPIRPTAVKSEANMPLRTFTPTLPQLTPVPPMPRLNTTASNPLPPTAQPLSPTPPVPLSLASAGKFQHGDLPDMAALPKLNTPGIMPGAPSATPISINTGGMSAPPGAIKTGGSRSIHSSAGPVPMSTGSPQANAGPTELAPVKIGGPGTTGADSIPGPTPTKATKGLAGRPGTDPFVVTPKILDKAAPFNAGDDGKEDKGFKTTPDPDFSQYMANLQRKIKRSWQPPKDSLTKRVVVVFTVHTNGTMTGLELQRPSGSAQADSAAMQAVRASSPFEPLPQFAPPSVDIQFTFDYNVISGSN